MLTPPRAPQQPQSDQGLLAMRGQGGMEQGGMEAGQPGAASSLTGDVVASREGALGTRRRSR